MYNQITKNEEILIHKNNIINYIISLYVLTPEYLNY
jgi:hypothetical protein